MNAILCLLHFPVFVSYSMSPLPHSHPPNPTSSNNAKLKEVPTFAALRQFWVAEQVTCHNSGKSLWLDLEANSWHGMVEWQRLRLTLSTQQQPNRSPARIRGSLTRGPASCTVSHKSLYSCYLRLLSHIGCTLTSSTQKAVASGDEYIGQQWWASQKYTHVFVSTLRKPSGSLYTSMCQQLDASQG